MNGFVWVSRPNWILSCSPSLLSCCRSFSSLPYGSEEDMRFIYCACAISYILDDWSGVDGAAMVRYVNSCLVRNVSL